MFRQELLVYCAGRPIGIHHVDVVVVLRPIFATLGGGVSVRVVPELTEHPGAEDDTKSWQGEVDVGVRVCLKMCRQFGFEVADLAVEFGDDADRGAGGGGERGGDRGGCGELLGSQRGLDVAEPGRRGCVVAQRL